MRPAGGMPRRKQRITAAQTKELRKKERQKVGRLRHQVVAKRTEDRYHTAFQSFCRFHGLDTSFGLPAHDEFDDMASDYIEYLWESGEPKSAANYVLAALQYFRPQCKKHLPWAWKLVKVWNQVELPLRATPLSPELMMAFAGQATSYREYTFAHLVVVGFALFLRTGELLALSGADVTMGRSSAVIFIPSSKGAKRKFLPVERLELTEASALRSLRYLLKEHPRNTPFWAKSRNEFMVIWHQIVGDLRLDDFHFRPYSLRRGGATSAFKAGVSLDRLLELGRWQHASTARIYLDSGLQALTSLALPRPAQKLISSAVDVFLALSQ